MTAVDEQAGAESCEQLEHALNVLQQRRDWLYERIGAKTRIGWDTAWDEREHRALCTVIRHLRGDV